MTINTKNNFRKKTPAKINPAETLQKFMANAGFASRRKSETFIDHNLVKINGKIAKLGDRVNGGDLVEVKTSRGIVSLSDQSSKKVYIKLNKPVGYTCTNRRFEGEDNVFDLVKMKERLFVCGRLDKDSQGLVLLTNDGDLDLKLTHPAISMKRFMKSGLDRNLTRVPLKE